MNYAVLTRQPGDNKETLGTLTGQAHGSSFTCRTLELAWKDNQHNISCIPPGKYLCKWEPFHATHHYELQDVPNRTGIFIHNGDFFKDTLGCIILGASPVDLNGDGELDLTNTNPTLAAFEALFGKQDFYLTVV